MRHTRVPIPLLLFAGPIVAAPSGPKPLTFPFVPDDHTLLLYHFDDGQGTVAKDAGKGGYDGDVQGAQWADGRFGKALRFNGKGDRVFRQATEAFAGLRQITFECWFNQETIPGRQFLLGKGGAFYLELVNGVAAAVSLYNSGPPKNLGDPTHRYLVTPDLVDPASGWHHLAATYDGQSVSFFVDGILKYREIAPEGYHLGAADAGLWVGSYKDEGMWFSGMIDEVRLSDCVRYDPAGTLKLGHAAFRME